MKIPFLKLATAILLLMVVVVACKKEDNTTNDKGVLINGVRWATRNVNRPGTFTANPEDAGMYYQWNRKVGWSADPLINSDGGTIWDSSISKSDTWENKNDPCPAGWRVPTAYEFQSLIEAGNQWTKLNDINGSIFGFNDQTIFLPAAGYIWHGDGTLFDVDTAGCYWSSSVDSSNFYGTFPISLVFRTTTYVNTNQNRGSLGFSIRCVAE